MTYIKDLQQIYARMFDMDGNPRDDEFQISEDSLEGSSKSNAVAMNGNGEFVVTWNGDRHGRLQEGEHLILMKRFNSDGQPKDIDPVKVNTAFELANQFDLINSRPSVAINAKGGCAVSWSTRYVLFSNVMTIGQGFITQHMVRRYNQFGLPVGPAKKVNAVGYISFLSPEGRGLSDAGPVVAMNEKGNFAVSHYRYNYHYGVGFEVYHDAAYRFFSKTGIAQSTDRKIDIFTQPDSLVNAMDSKGNLVMGWTGCETNEACDGNEAIYLMQVSRTSPRSQQTVKVTDNAPDDSTENASGGFYPALDVSEDGRVVVIWHNNENLLGRIYLIQ